MQAFPFDSELTYDDHDNPIYDRAVSSQPLRKLIKELFTTGVMPNPSTNFQVSAGSDGMTVQVEAGFAVIDGGLCQEIETRTLEVTAADNTYDRIDTVVLRWNENVDVRTADLYVIAGTPAVNPVRPTLQRNNSIYEIGLADVFITKRVATITNDKITDTRYEAQRCGVVSSVSEWDTTTIYQQIQADLAGFKANEQANFMAWFETIQNILDGDLAGHLQNEIDYITPKIHTNLINPDLYTISSNTSHGITITANNDGTFILDGTADNDAGSDGYVSINLATWGGNAIVCENQTQVRLCGCPSGFSGNLRLQFADTNDNDQKSWFADIGNGVVADLVDGKLTLYALRIQVKPNTTLNNVVIKPMITNNLTATYNDFVPYFGGSGRINEDVANLYNEISRLGHSVNTLDGSKIDRFSNSTYTEVTGLAYDPVRRKLGLKLAGADSVVPFNSKSDILTVHTFSGSAQYKGSVAEPTSVTINMKTKTNRWAELTTANFFNIVTESLYNTGPYAQSPTGRAGIFVSVHAPETSYNPSTGILTIRQAYAGGACYSTDGGTGYFATQNINLGGVVYCVI